MPSTYEGRRIPTSDEVLAQQAHHYNTLAETKPPAGNGNLPARPVASDGGVVAKPATSQAVVNAYLDAIAPAQLVGREIQFSKNGDFITRDDEKTISETRVFINHADQTLIGRIKFNGKGEKPDVHMGLLYEGYIMPGRESLGDNDPATWELGLNGEPQDPWQNQMYVVLQDAETDEMFTFVSRSVTGLRAIGNLLRHYERLKKTHPDMYPLVNLKKGGFNHRDTRVGWVSTPAFAVVGRHPKDSAAKPDASPRSDLEDEVPF
jgi:hypothetical protein